VTWRNIQWHEARAALLWQLSFLCHIHANPNAVVSLHCQGNQQNCYNDWFCFAALWRNNKYYIYHVSLSDWKWNSRLSAVFTLFFVVPSHMEGHHRKVEGHIKKFSAGTSRRHLCYSTFKLFPAPLPDGEKMALCIRRTRTRTQTRTLCIGRSLCRHVTIGTPMVILLSWLSFDCFDCFNCFWRLVHCWYSLGRPSFECFWRFVQCTIVKNSQKTVKTVKTAKMTISVPIVTCLSRLYQQCTNRQKQSKTVKRQSKQPKWPLVYQLSHVYTESAEYTMSASASASAVRVRRIYKAKKLRIRLYDY